MTVEELFQRLSYGPFSNIAVGNQGSGGILETKKVSMIHYTNDALLRLHTRMLLIENSLVLRQVDGISNYVIKPENTYTASISDDPPVGAIPYIQDTSGVPFQDDLIKILAVVDHCGCEVRLNDEAACKTYFTPQNHILQIPCPVNDELVFLTYQARHPKIGFNPIDMKQEITLPSTLEEALIAYIAYLQYSSMNGTDNVNRATEYLNRYNAICAEVEGRGITNTNDNRTNTKLYQKGFV